MMQVFRSLACVAFLGLMIGHILQRQWASVAVSGVFAAFCLWRLADVAANAANEPPILKSSEKKK